MVQGNVQLAYTPKNIVLENQNWIRFSEDVHYELQNSTSKTCLVYIHGYNCSFKDAAERCAEIACGTDFKGIATFFSWPSYVYLNVHKSQSNLGQDVCILERP